MKRANDMFDDDEDDIFNDGSDMGHRAAAGELRSFVERLERLAGEKRDIADQMKEVFAEAKARGYDTKAIRKILSLRARDKDDVAEEEAIVELYRQTLGM